MKLIFVTVLCLCLCLCGAAQAQTAQVDRIDIVEYGIYTSTPSGAVANGDVPSGKVTTRAQVWHAQTTTIIPAQQGVEFGFRFNIVGSPSGVVVPLHVVAIFPPPGLHDASSGQTFEKAEFDRADGIGPGGYISYSFDHDWERVPGVWTFQIWNQGRMLAEQKFTVVAQ